MSSLLTYDYQLFISYARGENEENLQQVLELKEELEDCGRIVSSSKPRIFLDEHSIGIGDELTQTILQAIERSRTALVVLTQLYCDKVNSNNGSNYCKTEFMRITQNQKKHIVVLVMEENLRDKRNWGPLIEEHCGDILYFDMSGNWGPQRSDFKENCQRLYHALFPKNQIMKIIRVVYDIRSLYSQRLCSLLDNANDENIEKKINELLWPIINKFKIPTESILATDQRSKWEEWIENLMLLKNSMLSAHYPQQNVPIVDRKLIESLGHFARHREHSVQLITIIYSTVTLLYAEAKTAYIDASNRHHQDGLCNKLTEVYYAVQDKIAATPFYRRDVMTENSKKKLTELFKECYHLYRKCKNVMDSFPAEGTIRVVESASTDFTMFKDYVINTLLIHKVDHQAESIDFFIECMNITPVDSVLQIAHCLIELEDQAFAAITIHRRLLERLIRNFFPELTTASPFVVSPCFVLDSNKCAFNHFFENAENFIARQKMMMITVRIGQQWMKNTERTRRIYNAGIEAPLIANTQTESKLPFKSMVEAIEMELEETEREHFDNLYRYDYILHRKTLAEAQEGRLTELCTNWILTEDFGSFEQARNERAQLLEEIISHLQYVADESFASEIIPQKELEVKFVDLTLLKTYLERIEELASTDGSIKMLNKIFVEYQLKQTTSTPPTKDFYALKLLAMRNIITDEIIPKWQKVKIHLSQLSPNDNHKIFKIIHKNHGLELDDKLSCWSDLVENLPKIARVAEYFEQRPKRAWGKLNKSLNSLLHGNYKTKKQRIAIKTAALKRLPHYSYDWAWEWFSCEKYLTESLKDLIPDLYEICRRFYSVLYNLYEVITCNFRNEDLVAFATKKGNSFDKRSFKISKKICKKKKTVPTPVIIDNQTSESDEPSCFQQFIGKFSDGVSDYIKQIEECADRLKKESLLHWVNEVQRILQIANNAKLVIDQYKKTKFENP